MSDKDDKEPSVSEFSETTQSHLAGPMQKRIQDKFNLVFPFKLEESEEDEVASIEQKSTDHGSISFNAKPGDAGAVVLNFEDDGTGGMELTSNSESSSSANAGFNFDSDDSGGLEFGVNSGESVSMEVDSGESVSFDVDSTEAVSFDVDASEAVSMEVDAGEAVSFDVDAGEAVSFDVDAGEAVSFDVDAGEAVSFDVDAGEAVSMEVDAGEAVSFSADSGEGLSFGAGDDDFEIESSSKTKSSITQPKIPTNPSISYIAGNKLANEAQDTAKAVISDGSDDDLFGSPASPPVVESKNISSATEDELNDINYIPPEVEIVPDAPVSSVSSVSSVSAAPVSRSVVEDRSSFISDEDSARVHGTIRQLREEREELLEQIKNFKSGMRELQQDNLTLKAALDDIKIEYSIIKKRHLSEVEDLKDRIAINEKKKIIAEDKAKVIELQKQKLEQKIKIDYNQVKQREKTLESQLEMITIELDSRIQIREQKILELNRKIESLEFNMENIAFRDQKSQDDKRKLEDKLSKIMKTLRHSIKNLEDDIELVSDEIDEQVLEDETRPGKTKL
jgi:hypothetical protein